MTPTETTETVVIGSGIIGAMSALYLQADGHSVTMIEQGELAGGASAGNAGILAFPEIIPIAAPGVMNKAPKWLLDPLGPLSLRPGYALQMIPWLWRFWRASSPSAFRHCVEVHAAMMGLAETEMQHVLTRTGLGHMVSNTGTLDLYDSKRSLDAAAADWREKARSGVEFSTIGRGDIERLQPGIADRFQHGIFTPAGLQVSDPRDFARAIIEFAAAQGMKKLSAKVERIEPVEGGARVVLAGGRVLQARHVIVAAGAWSKTLAKSLGDHAPLETERGYNTTLPPGAFPLKKQLYFNDHGFVVTPLSTGIRVGGAVELGGLDLPPNFRRSEAMLTKAKSFLPDLKVEGGRQWMGFRPSLPDCIPVIGPSKATPAVVYAFGHGHLGLTQSASTGRLVADIVARRSPSIGIEPFAIGRFAR